MPKIGKKWPKIKKMPKISTDFKKMAQISMLGLRVFACLPQPPVPLSHTDQSSQVRSWRPSPKDGWHRKHIIIWNDQDNDKKTKRHFDRRRTLSNRDIPRNQESWKRKHCIKEQTGRNSLAHKGDVIDIFPLLPWRQATVLLDFQPRES